MGCKASLNFRARGGSRKSDTQLTKSLDLILFALGAAKALRNFLWHGQGMGTPMVREEGCSRDKVLHFSLLRVPHISFAITGKALRAPYQKKTKTSGISVIVDLDFEVFVLRISDQKKKGENKHTLPSGSRKMLTDTTGTVAIQICAKDSPRSRFISRGLICLSPARQVKCTHSDTIHPVQKGSSSVFLQCLDGTKTLFSLLRRPNFTL